MDIKKIKFLNELNVSNKEKIFFSNCMDEGVSEEMIQNLLENLKKYKNLMKQNDLNINNVINNKEYNSFYKTFEDFDDKVEKTIIRSKGKKLLRSLVSNKYSHLINEETKEIFITLAKSNISRKILENGLFKKIAMFENSNDFNKALIENYISVNNKEVILEKAKNLGVKILHNEKNKLKLFIDSHKEMKEFGSNMWCVQRSERTFEKYTKTGSYFIISYDFDLPGNNPESLMASIVSSKGMIFETYDSNDNLNNTKNEEIESYSKSFSYKEFISRIKESENKISDLVIGGLINGYNEEMDKIRKENNQNLLDEVDYLSLLNYVKAEDFETKRSLLNVPDKFQKTILNNIFSSKSRINNELLLFITNDAGYLKNAQDLINEKNKKEKEVLKTIYDDYEKHSFFERSIVKRYFYAFEETSNLKERVQRRSHDKEYVLLQNYIYRDTLNENSLDKLNEIYKLIPRESIENDFLNYIKLSKNDTVNLKMFLNGSIEFKEKFAENLNDESLMLILSEKGLSDEDINILKENLDKDILIKATLRYIGRISRLGLEPIGNEFSNLSKIFKENESIELSVPQNYANYIIFTAANKGLLKEDLFTINCNGALNASECWEAIEDLHENTKINVDKKELTRLVKKLSDKYPDLLDYINETPVSNIIYPIKNNKLNNK